MVVDMGVTSEASVFVRFVFVRFVKDQIVVDADVASEASVLFHWFIRSLFWYQYHAVLITVAL